MSRILLALAGLSLCFLLSYCIERKPDRIVKKDAPVVGEMANVIQADSVLRLNLDIPDTTKFRLARENREIVYRLLSLGLIVDPEDLYRAAIVLQHAEPPAARDCCLFANKLAQAAVEKGLSKAKYLVAASYDRYLIMSGQPQKYGTQYTRNRAGQYVILPYDMQTPDSVRLALSVPTLDSLQKELKVMGHTPGKSKKRK